MGSRAKTFYSHSQRGENVAPITVVMIGHRLLNADTFTIAEPYRLILQYLWEAHRHRAWLRRGSQLPSVRVSITSHVSILAGAYHLVLAGSAPKVMPPVAA